ncbi:MAG: polyprenyl synthetase family protein [Candidatus Tectomicrobia bacterium]|uniref:Polyprenyl synthetase family protein n=1 Tax=Tectimicrobiota bacterium TaxID=2528274 RepID=A0A933LQT9_UNCTE|nr:polyprenyl synthetase family protein [Candidatus Tectomicrobia bacterium]
MNFEGIITLIKGDLEKVEHKIQDNFISDIKLIPVVGNHLFGGGGKRIRPILVLLSSKLCGYEGERSILHSCVVEFIHTATLLHDDVVDGAEKRRGIPSANYVWGNQASVLVGDFLLARSFLMMSLDGSLPAMRVWSQASLCMAEGEVAQLINIRNLALSEDEYFHVIEKKTAALISACCQVGAILGEMSSPMEEALTKFGYYVGMAFQLVDDALDYVAEEEKLGKAIGKDLREGNITLPLIYLLKKATEKERSEIITASKSKDITDDQVQHILNLMNNYETISYTLSRARNFANKAKKELAHFNDSIYLDALLGVADYIVEREI